MTPLNQRRHPFVVRCRGLAAGGGPGGADEPEVLLDGPRLLGEAIASGVEISAAAVTRRFSESPAHAGLMGLLESRAGELFLAAEAVMDAASPARTPAGVVAVARFPQVGGGRMFRPGGLVLGAVGVQDPGNMGALLRVAEAAGAQGVVAAEGCASPLGWKALRAAAGSAFRLPVESGVSAADACGRARAAGYRIVATCPAGGVEPAECDFRPDTFLLVGGEGPGLDAALIAAADGRLRIPMQPPVESLNVAVAAGILLYEARRQRAANSFS